MSTDKSTSRKLQSGHTSYNELSIVTNRENAEFVIDEMQTRGALSVTITDGGKDDQYDLAFSTEPTWVKQKVTGLFAADVATKQFADNFLNEVQGVSNCSLQHLEDQDWERIWLSRYHPIRIVDGFWVCPSWCQPKDNDAVNLIIDPGLAFGTGTHTTTRLCLEWLAQANLHGRKVIDYGCGSGILTIAAILHGADFAEGIDIDPRAISTARKNANINGVENKCRFNDEKYRSEKPVDIVLANILSDALINLSDTLTRLTKPNGHVVLSGILKKQEDSVMQSFEETFTFNTVYRDDWILLVGTRK